MRSMKMIKLVLVMVVASVCVGVSAEVPWAVNGPKRKIVTLVITGNYKSSRLLAELIQNESRQPYILLPTRESGDTRIIFCPPKSASLLIREDKFNSFVRFLNPRRIVVLGDASYVQPKYISMLDRTIPIVQIESADWQRTAEETADLLNLSNLPANYKRLREILLNDGKLYRSISRPAAPVAPMEAPLENNAESSPADDAAATADPGAMTEEVVETTEVTESAEPAK